MRNLPHWDWPFMLVCQAIAAAAAGVLSGVVARSFGGIFAGLIFVPITNALLTAVLSGFFYYTFAYVYNQPQNYQHIYTHLIFAQLPALAVFILVPALAPLALFEPLVAGLLLYVGFVSNLNIDKKKLAKLLMGLYALFFVFWIINSISSKNQTEAFRGKATPESLDILEKEIKDH